MGFHKGPSIKNTYVDEYLQDGCLNDHNRQKISPQISMPCSCSTARLAHMPFAVAGISAQLGAVRFHPGRLRMA